MPSLDVETRNLLRSHGLHPRQALGQNFVVDRTVVTTIIRAADLSRDDLVLEIGPGVGNLTSALSLECADVVAVELDEALARVLKLRTAGLRNVQVITANILHTDLSPWIPIGQPFKLVANIPYYITAPILRHFLEGPLRPQLLVLMVQREVADRLAARPGRLSLLGVSAQYYARVELIATIPSVAFFPPPKVDSAIVRLVPHRVPPFQVADSRRFFKVVKAGFGEKRKQLHNALVRGLAHIPATQIDAALEAAAIDRTRRAETLSLGEWAALDAALSLRDRKANGAVSEPIG